jgi:selenocysteine lyase/cysteine desulfurase
MRKCTLETDYVNDWRKLFDLPDDVAYFNCASLSPLMHTARAALDEALQRRARPWLMTTREWVDDVEERRTLFAQLVGADVEGIALVPAASYGLAVAARNLGARAGSRIVLPADEFPSDVYTWRAFAQAHGAEIVTVGRGRDQGWTEAVLDRIDERCSIVSVPNVHWTNGGLFDLVAIGARCREVGARLVVDASQSLGAMPFDFDAVRPDFLVAVGYKWLLGPYGQGYLYVAEEHRDGTPLEENWISREGSEDFSRLIDYVERYRSGARRFDVGERSALELTGAATAALRQLSDWGIDTVARTLRQTTDRIERKALELGLAISETHRGPHMVGLDLPDGVANPGGMLGAAKVFVGVRGKSLRIAPHLYNTESDLQRLFDALTMLASKA